MTQCQICGTQLHPGSLVTSSPVETGFGVVADSTEYATDFLDSPNAEVHTFDRCRWAQALASAEAWKARAERAERVIAVAVACNGWCSGCHSGCDVCNALAADPTPEAGKTSAKTRHDRDDLTAGLVSDHCCQCGAAIDVAKGGYNTVCLSCDERPRAAKTEREGP